MEHRCRYTGATASINVAGEWIQDCLRERTAHPKSICWFLLDLGFGQELKELAFDDMCASPQGVCIHRIGCSLWECWSTIERGNKLGVSAWRRKVLLWLSFLVHFQLCKAALCKVRHFYLTYSLSLIHHIKSTQPCNTQNSNCTKCKCIPELRSINMNEGTDCTLNSVYIVLPVMTISTLWYIIQNARSTVPANDALFFSS